MFKDHTIEYNASGLKDCASAMKKNSNASWEFCKVFPFSGKFLVAFGEVNLSEYYQNYIWYVICEKFNWGNPDAFFSKYDAVAPDARYRAAADMLFCEEVWGFIDGQFDTEEDAMRRFYELTGIAAPQTQTA